MSILDDHKPEFERSMEHYKAELATIRTGRANAGLIENVLVSSYGTKTPIKQLGSINVSDPRSMTVEPWDKGLLKEVEKAIASANLGLGTSNMGNLIRVTVPAMTEENRKNLVKVLKDKAESARIVVRGLRDKIREAVIEQEKSGDLTEDDKYRLQKDLDELSAKYNDKIKELTDSKEQEIMTI